MKTVRYIAAAILLGTTVRDAEAQCTGSTVVADACSTPAPAYVTRAIHLLVRQLHGFVAQSSDLIAALPSSPSIRKGKR